MPLYYALPLSTFVRILTADVSIFAAAFSAVFPTFLYGFRGFSRRSPERYSGPTTPPRPWCLPQKNPRESGSDKFRTLIALRSPPTAPGSSAELRLWMISTRLFCKEEETFFYSTTTLSYWLATFYHVFWYRDRFSDIVLFMFFDFDLFSCFVIDLVLDYLFSRFVWMWILIWKSKPLCSLRKLYRVHISK